MRLVLLAMHILYAVLITGIYRLRNGMEWHNTEHGKILIQSWVQRACRILAIQVHIRGEKSIVQDTLYVANHVSWIDIIALWSMLDIKFISKKTVKYWPVIGWLAIATGTLFISRGKHFALSEVIDTARRELDRSQAILLFPEGTTTDGRQVARFHASLFKAVSGTNHFVQAVALRYQRLGQRDTYAPYIDKDNFVAHLFRIASLKETCLMVDFTRAFQPNSMSRHDIASTAYANIVNVLEDRQEDRLVSARLVARADLARYELMSSVRQNC